MTARKPISILDTMNASLTHASPAITLNVYSHMFSNTDTRAAEIIMLERDARIGGEHTWSHFATDVSPAISEWLAPLIVRDWAGYDVRFPAHGRTLTTHYRSITSDRLHEVLSELLGADAWLGGLRIVI